MTVMMRSSWCGLCAKPAGLEIELWERAKEPSAETLIKYCVQYSDAVHRRSR